MALFACVWIRELNQIAIKTAYPLPRIDVIFTSLHNAYCFLSFALLMGYQQIPERAEDRPKTAFITDKGLYVFNVMPFEVCNAPLTLHRLRDGIFRNHFGEALEA